ncbi:unnamed protein product [Ilex paraguariensis]|uniref:GTD-binding domain-containing protein n=1 Tax=Ilex paraguariensis TaxID=185542 RepID=A0ABC8UGX2_9AQUA
MTEEDLSIQVCSREEESLEILHQHLEFFIDCSGNRLVPIALIDSKTKEDYSRCSVKEEDQEHIDHQEAILGSELQVEAEVKSVVENRCVGGQEAVFSAHENKEEPKFQPFESMEIMREVYDQVAIIQATQTPSEDDDVQAMAAENDEERDADVPQVSEEVSQVLINETEAEVSIGTEIPDLDTTDEIQTEETLSSYACTHEHPSISSVHIHEDDDRGFEKTQGEMVELKILSGEVCKHGINSHSSLGLELNEIEDNRVPDTPNSTDSFNQLNKKLLLLENRDSGTEDSLEGSVTSEFEGELEEERSASAVATNQTMEMINRLQEEKAAMQMEALQYQRMMEEQSEYDQEVLQLFNELMVKREKEKQELEKELEMNRKKLLDYDAKEKMRRLRRSKDGSARSGFSSASCSNVEDSDGLSIDLNQEAKEDNYCCSYQENGSHHTPVDGVLDLEESLADFEEERLFILEQLKVLEEKLETLSDEEEQHFEDVSRVGHFQEGNGDQLDENAHFGNETNRLGNGFSKKIKGSMGKRLLPLFDAISVENGDGMVNGHENEFHINGWHNTTVTKVELESKKMDIEEEVNHLYKRLQALETDREFLRHCISSVKKGDKGIDLLQEILQHLRDLRNVDLRVRNLSDGALV